MLCKIITLPDIKRNMNFNILFSQVGTIILNAIQKLSIHEIQQRAIKQINSKILISAYEIQKCYILLNNNTTDQT